MSTPLPDTNLRKPLSTAISANQNETRFKSHHFLLAAIILWIFGGNLIWMLIDIRPPSWDQGLHLYKTFNYWKALSSGSEQWWLDVLNVEPFYPPFYHLSLIPLSLIFGFSLDIAIIGNSFYMVVIVLSIYGIGKILYHRQAGLIAAFLVSCYPLMVGMSREYIISVSLTAFTTLAYYLFLKSENFENRKYTLLLSLVYASGLMVKWTFLLYTLPAIFAGLWGDKLNFRDRIIQLTFYFGMIAALLILPLFIFILGEQRWVPLILELLLIWALVKNFPKSSLSVQKAINLTSLACISVLICFPWYAHNLINISIGMSKFAFPSAVLKGTMYWDLPIWGFYLEMIARQMGIPLLVVFFTTLLFYIFKRDQFNWTLFGWVILPIIVFTFINNKGARYTMPSLPAMALVTAVILTQVKIIFLRRTLYFFTGGIALITAIYTGFIPGDIRLPYFGGSLFGQKNIPVKQFWPIDPILDDIVEEEKPEKGRLLTVRTLTNYIYFQRGAFRDFAAIRDLPIVMKSVKRNVGEMTDFFITKTGDFGMHAFKAINPKKNILLKDPALTKTFKLFRSYPLPDGTKALVLKYDMEPAHDLPGVTDLDLIGKRFIDAFANYPIYGVKNPVNMTVTISPTENPQDIFYGRYKSIHVKADSAVSNKVKVVGFELLFENVQINIYDLLLNGRFILFSLERLTPRGTIHFEDLEKSAATGMKGKGNITINGSKNSLHLHVKYSLPQGRFVEGKTKINLQFTPGEKIRPAIEYLKLGPFDIPNIFIRRITDEEIILTPTPGWPLATNIQSLEISPRKIEINPGI